MKNLKFRIKSLEPILVILGIATAMERALAYVEKQFPPMLRKSERVVMERRRKLENLPITKIFSCGTSTISILMTVKIVA